MHGMHRQKGGKTQFTQQDHTPTPHHTAYLRMNRPKGEVTTTDLAQLVAMIRQLGLTKEQVGSLVDSPTPSIASTPPTEAPTSTLTPTAATSTQPSIASLRESAKENAKGNDLFSKWYFGDETMDKLLKAIDASRSAQLQNRHWIGLVQATMMGTWPLPTSARSFMSNLIVTRGVVAVVQARPACCSKRPSIPHSS